VQTNEGRVIPSSRDFSINRVFDFRILCALQSASGKTSGIRLSASHTGARMEPATPAHDILAATLIALVSIFASVLGISGLKRRARKFAKNAPTKAG
jgi:hypothetical protein